MTDTKTITLALDVMALNIPDGQNCEAIKAASVRLIEQEKTIQEVRTLASGLWGWSNMMDDTNLERLRKIIQLTGDVAEAANDGTERRTASQDANRDGGTDSAIGRPLR